MAPIIADTRTGEIHYLNSHYYLGHFSRFILPGAQRIVSSYSHDNLLSTAAVNPDGSIVLIVLNRTDEEVDYRVWIDGQSARMSIPANAIVTAQL